MAVIRSERGLVSLGEGEHRCPLVPGLVLRIRGKRRTWNVRAKGQRVTLGTYPELGLADARERARHLLGGDLSTLTVRRGLELYVADLRRRRKDRDAQVERGLERHLKPVFGERISTLPRKRLQQIVDALSPGAARQAAAMIQAMFSYLHRHAHTETPAPVLARPPAGPSRDRVLGDEEIRRLWAVTEVYPVIRLMLLTGLRKGEATGLRAEDLVDGCIVVPAERTKARRKLVLPLPGSTLVVAEATVAIRSPTLEGHFLARLHRESETEGFTFHDLRRTAATRMAALGIDPWIIERILNHHVPTLMRTYQRADYLPGMKDALARLADHLDKLTSS